MQDWDILEKRLRALDEEVARLKEEVGALRRRLQGNLHPVEKLLAQRGLAILSHGAGAQLIVPPDLPEPQQTRFYHLMRRYSFRLFLRDLIQFPRGRDMSTLARYCSLRTVRAYLKELEDLGAVKISADGGYRLRRDQISSFGPTLEWFVSGILQRDFLSPALFNVKLKDTRHGGDYDVISLLADHLVYLEVKSSPPRGVERSNVLSFLKRLRDLQPHAAIFLVDTELRMKDKIVPLFEEALEEMAAQKELRTAERLVDEIFHLEHVVYLTNSRKGIYSNLRRCFRDFLRHAGTTSHSPAGIIEGGTGETEG